MTRIHLAGLVFLAWLVAGFSSGCTSQNNEQGVVARVNGEPIFLSEVEARHDLKHLVRPIGTSLSLEKLRTEYGMVLSEIVANKLVSQFLGERGLAVGDQDVDAVEAQVRADYPGEAFERILVEEYIDLGIWREQIRATLNQEKLFQKVLRPSISIDYQEVDAYYRENIVDFYLRPRVRFLVIQGQDRESVDKVLEMSREENDPVELDRRFDRVEVRGYTLFEDNIPGDWQELLEGLEPGQHSSVLLRNGTINQALVLLDRTPGRIVDPAQAYPLVERILVDRKLLEAYEAWLADAIQAAKIEVNSDLLIRETKDTAS